MSDYSCGFFRLLGPLVKEAMVPWLQVARQVIYLYLYVHTYIYTHTYIYVRMYIHICIYIYIYIYIYTCTCISIYASSVIIYSSVEYPERYSCIQPEDCMFFVSWIFTWPTCTHELVIRACVLLEMSSWWFKSTPLCIAYIHILVG